MYAHRLAQERDSQRTRACAGRNTQNSVPGGLFMRPAEPQSRPSMDGIANGRFNSSSVMGGPLIGAAAPQPVAGLRKAPFATQHATANSVSGGIFAQQENVVQQPPSPPRDVGPILGGGGLGAPKWAGDNAAGGRSTNAGTEWSHTRGALRGDVVEQCSPSHEYAAGTRSPSKSPSSREHGPGAFAKMLQQPDAASATQGDQLNALKARRQHHRTTQIRII